jgi:hypothetical protein
MRKGRVDGIHFKRVMLFYELLDPETSQQMRRVVQQLLELLPLGHQLLYLAL